VGGATSSSSNTVFIESGAGIEEGAADRLATRDGAPVPAAMFVAPLASIVPTEVAARRGDRRVMMMSQLRHIEISEFSVACRGPHRGVMPFSYSIANGIASASSRGSSCGRAAGQVRPDQSAVCGSGCGPFVSFFRTQLDRVGNRL